MILMNDKAGFLSCHQWFAFKCEFNNTNIQMFVTLIDPISDYCLLAKRYQGDPLKMNLNLMPLLKRFNVFLQKNIYACKIFENILLIHVIRLEFNLIT